MSIRLPKEDRFSPPLLQLENAVKSMPTANPKPNLLPLFARIDELTEQLPRGTDPTLLHYLHKKSYEKARIFLQGRDAENQIRNCRHDVTICWLKVTRLNFAAHAASQLTACNL